MDTRAAYYAAHNALQAKYILVIILQLVKDFHRHFSILEFNNYFYLTYIQYFKFSCIHIIIIISVVLLLM